MRALIVAIALSHAGGLPPYAEVSSPSTAMEEDPFVWQVDPAVVAPGSTGRIIARLVVPSGYVIYQDQVEVRALESGALEIGAADLPPAVTKADPIDGTDGRAQYPFDVVIYLDVTAPEDALGGIPVKLETRHQGCRPGLCFPPLTLTHDVLVAVRAESE